MKKLIITSLIILLSLSSYKMFEFRERLHEIIDNTKWENTLRSHGFYDSGSIVFFGDSHFALWKMARSFGCMPIINRGISGDQAAKAVNRFDRDVIGLKPKIAVILLGTNDIGHGVPIDSIVADIDYMIGGCKNNGIIPVVCGLPPTREDYSDKHPKEKIVVLNSILKALARQRGINYIDIYSTLADKTGFIKGEYATKDSHLSPEGYLEITKIMLPILMRGLTKIERKDL